MSSHERVRFCIMGLGQQKILRFYQVNIKQKWDAAKLVLFFADSGFRIILRAEGCSNSVIFFSPFFFPSPEKATVLNNKRSLRWVSSALLVHTRYYVFCVIKRTSLRNWSTDRGLEVLSAGSSGRCQLDRLMWPLAWSWNVHPKSCNME